MKISYNAFSTAQRTIATVWASALGMKPNAPEVSYLSIVSIDFGIYFKMSFSLSMRVVLSWWMQRLRQCSLSMQGKLGRFLTRSPKICSRKRNQIAIGMFVSTTMAQSWEDASTHATTMTRVRINAWTSSKLANLTALVRSVNNFIFNVSFNFIRTIVPLGVLVTIILVQRQQQLQMLQLQQHQPRPHLPLQMQS